jgi:hypothetical protein
MGNGTRVFDQRIDGRSLIGRRYAELTSMLARDSCPDVDQMTEAQIQIHKTSAGLIILRENLDVKIAKGEEVDVATYCRIANSLNRTLVTGGLKRVPKDVGPTLGDILVADHRRRLAEVVDAGADRLGVEIEGDDVAARDEAELDDDDEDSP